MTLLDFQEFISQRLIHILAVIYIALFIFSIVIRFTPSKGPIYLLLHVFFTFIGIWQIYTFGTTVWRVLIYLAVLTASFIIIKIYINANLIYFDENNLEKRMINIQALLYSIFFVLNFIPMVFTFEPDSIFSKLISTIGLNSVSNSIRELLTALCLLIPIGFHFYAIVYKNYKTKWFFIAPGVAIVALLLFINQHWGLTTFME